jgi:hypothetical protein
LVLFAVMPMLLAMLAALANAYPYTGARTMVFVMPALALLIGAGLDGLVEWRPQNLLTKRISLAGCVVPVAAILALALYRIVVPWPRAETAAASAYVLSHRQANEPVTANHWEYEYYFRHLDGAFVPGMRLLDQPQQPARVWVVLTSREMSARAELIRGMPRWEIIERHEFAGTSVLLASPKR